MTLLSDLEAFYHEHQREADRPAIAVFGVEALEEPPAVIE